MTILDTNVISTFMDATPDPTVSSWLDRQPSQSIWVTSVTVFEVRFGIELLPHGRRRESLSAAFSRLIEEKLDNRVLDFDKTAAVIAADLAARRRREGRPIEIYDTQIAGVVLAHRATLATRNVKHFDDIGARIVNPWADR